MTQTKLPLQHFTNASDYFATELVSVEDLGQCARLSFSVPRQQGKEAFREIVAAIVVPKCALPTIARLCAQKPSEIREGNLEAEFESREFVVTH